MDHPSNPGRAEASPPRIDQALPDVRDGLSRLQRIVLVVLAQAQRERAGRSVPTAMLYGRVLEHADLSQAELIEVLQTLGIRDR